jgi:hypothetical protein
MAKLLAMAAAPPFIAPLEGDATTFLSLPALVNGLAGMPAPPITDGRLAFVVCRRAADHARILLDRVRVTPRDGIPNDVWATKEPVKPEDVRIAKEIGVERWRLDAQFAVMETRVARLIANGQPLTMFGDNLFLDLDLSARNLPPGSLIQIGREAVFEVTPKQHNGCKKFSTRFGLDALNFVVNKDTRQRNLRGIYLRVVEEGDIGPGDHVEVIERGTFRAIRNA